MRYSFLLIGKKAETRWHLILQQTLSPLGDLDIVPEEEAMSAVTRSDYDAVIIDAGSVSDEIWLVSHLRAQRSQLRIIVATASLTWRRARDVLQAGAADYIRKSRDEKELRSKIQAVLDVPPPLRPR